MSVPHLQFKDGFIPAQQLWAKLTSFSTPYYAWTEQLLTSSGWIDKPGGAFGTVSSNPAWDANGVVIDTSVTPVVLLYRGYFDATVDWVWVIVATDATGGGAANIIAHTSATFVVPAVDATVSVSITPDVDTDVWMVIGQTILVTDGTHVVYGHVTAVASTTAFTLYVDRIAGGLAGQTMATGAEVIISGDYAFLKSINDSSVQSQTIGINDAFPVSPGDNEINVYTSAIADPPPWSATVQYMVGWVVTDGGKQWRAVAASLNSQPPSANWVECTDDGINVISVPKVRIYTPDSNYALAGREPGATPVALPAGQNLNFKSVNSNLLITSDGAGTSPTVRFNAVGGVTIINVTNINEFNTFIENVIYFNFFDKKIYININNVWYEFCVCGSGLGSGGGSGTAGPVVFTDCCPDDPIPETLYGTISAKTGTCTCLPTALTFTYVGGSDWYSNTLTTCSYEGFLILSCSGGAWSLQNASVATGTLISTVCNPVLEIVFDMTADPATCTGTFTVTITT